MRIALASDHAGYDLKKGIAAELARLQIEHKDFGCGPGEVVDYVDPGAKAAEAVSRGEFDRAVLICGTGMGMGIVGNKFKGLRATPCWTVHTAEMSRRHNDSNCLTLGGRILSLEDGLAILKAWLETAFEGGRHARRVEKIAALENTNFK